MDFTNYKVAVFLKNGSKSTGLIHAVDRSQITLVADQGRQLRVNSVDIADIKVVLLPSKKKPVGELRSSTPRRGPVAKLVTLLTPDMLLEFDFEANLAMFDKRQVFADFQKRDTVDPSQRLVGHNRKRDDAKYDNREMVVDNSHGDSWDQIGTPTPTTVPPTATRSGLALGAGGLVKFVGPQGLDVACASPVQLLEIERLAGNFGVTQTLMAETVAVNLLLVIITKILGGATRLSNRNNHNLPPLVLLLVGTGRSGMRAFATGRHLANHGVRVLAFVLHGDDDDAELQQQQRRFEGAGGKVVVGEWTKLLEIVTHQLETPVELIIDGLQGYDCRVEDVFYEDHHLHTLREMVKWCLEPAQRVRVMSLDLPLGIDGGLGTAGDMVIRGKWCVLMGMPITGLLLAYRAQELDDDVVHYLIDEGIPNKVYGLKGNLRKFDKYWYCAELAFAIDVQRA